ncbi:hypothetical protein [Luteitalea sp.]|uniref:hypothetical protein n=1 Tax=Luteitalea sp. TaxID=2004800 RepID=UPI0037CCBB7C
MSPAFLSHVLLLLGAGFLVANLRILVDVVRFFRMRSRAVLTWPGQPPRYYPLFLAMAAMLGLVLIVKLAWLHLPPQAVFGEAMMLLYYGYLVPLSIRIGRGFYEDGVWVDNGFLPYHQIGGLSWREGEELTLLFIPRMKQVARSLVVPTPLYGATRRLLRDKIADHDIDFWGKALDLGAHDSRDDA